jgi:hypothetical protein
LHFEWADSLAFGFDSSFMRQRAALFYEIKKAHHLYAGRDISAKNSFFVLDFREARRKAKGELREAYKRSEEITKKVVFALRLLTFSPVYSDYRGIRTLGHYSAGTMGGMVLMNFPEEWIDDDRGQDLHSYQGALERLFASLLTVPLETFAVVYEKIEDSFRRQRRVVPFTNSEQRIAIDQLLDYVQALEAILQVNGSYQIALYATLLLCAAWREHGISSMEVFDFIKEMYTLRNNVVHGRIDKVIHGRTNTKHKITEIRRFRKYVHELAMLYVMNPSDSGGHNLQPFGHKLALGESVKLKTPYTG